MAAPLQKTKLFLPPASEKLVERARLLDQLDRARAEGCQEVLISAPAGSGKTTMVVQWLARLHWPAGWVSLDARDNHPARFFSYMIAALQKVSPGVGGEALALLELPGAALEEVITLLANDLAGFPEPFVLALDDFHVITNPALHQAVDLFLDAQPPQMRLVLLSREDPAMQLARRRARGQLLELRQNDLRFTLPEAVAFLNQAMGLRLTTGQAEALEARTEGWIAGLQMAALSLQHAPDADRFIRDFSGSHRFILDYLMEEVVSQQSEEIQQFLLATAPLEQFCAPLCDYVIRDSSIRDSVRVELSSSHITNPGSRITESRITFSPQQILEHLEKSNLFVIPLDEERRWYRYHHLFGDLLLARLRAMDPQRSAILCQRASGWYEDNGDPRAAVEYALKAQDLQRAAGLIERHFGERWQTVDLDFLLLTNRLPIDVITSRPALCLQSAWVYLSTGQAERIAPFVDAAERLLLAPGRIPEPADAGNLAFARILRAYLADFHNQPVVLDESLERAVTVIPEENTGMRNSVAIVIGTIYYMEGDFAGAMRYYRDALERDKRVKGTNAVPIAVMRMVWVLQAEGKLREAERLVSEHVDYIRERGSRRFYISGVLNLLWSELLLEWNRLEEAEHQLREGMRLMEDWPIPPVHSLGWSLLARLHAARSDLPGAWAALEHIDALQRKSRFHPAITQAADRARVRVWIAGQDRAALENWASETAPLAESEFRFRNEATLLELSRAWLALGGDAETGRHGEAVASEVPVSPRPRVSPSPRLSSPLLERLAEYSEQAPARRGNRIAILTLLAAARHADLIRALPVLDEALRLGAPEGYLRTFVESGEPLRPVLKAWLQRGPSRNDPALAEYAHRIQAAFDTPPAQPPVQPRQPVGLNEPASLIEPLSEREREVLLLVARGLTNQQIAARLVISVRTVKKHVENIHAKLGVQNRTQAAARARSLGLIKGE